MKKPCERCDKLGYICGRCLERDSECSCPYRGGRRPAVVVCPECHGTKEIDDDNPALRDARKGKK